MMWVQLPPCPPELCTVIFAGEALSCKEVEVGSNPARCSKYGWLWRGVCLLLKDKYIILVAAGSIPARCPKNYAPETLLGEASPRKREEVGSNPTGCSKFYNKLCREHAGVIQW